jgi:hypothetical protein
VDTVISVVAGGDTTPLYRTIVEAAVEAKVPNFIGTGGAGALPAAPGTGKTYHCMQTPNHFYLSYSLCLSDIINGANEQMNFWLKSFQRWHGSRTLVNIILPIGTSPALPHLS